jgi:hypothetical protein
LKVEKLHPSQYAEVPRVRAPNAVIDVRTYELMRRWKKSSRLSWGLIIDGMAEHCLKTKFKP